MNTTKHLVSIAALAGFGLLALGSGGKTKQEGSSDPASTTTLTKASDPVSAPAVPAAAAAAPAKAVTFAPLAIKNSGSPVKDMIIDAPAGATSEEKFTNTVVEAGEHFALLISHGKEDIKETKTLWAGPDSFMKVKKYDIDLPDTLLFEGEQFGVTNYHFVTNVKLGAIFYTCRNLSTPEAVYSKADAESMLKACKTLKKK